MALEALAGRWLEDMHGPSTSGHTGGRAEKEQVDLGEGIKNGMSLTVGWKRRFDYCKFS